MSRLVGIASMVGTGSGVIVGTSNEGTFIITAAHVVARNKTGIFESQPKPEVTSRVEIYLSNSQSVPGYVVNYFWGAYDDHWADYALIWVRGRINAVESHEELDEKAVVGPRAGYLEAFQYGMLVRKELVYTQHSLVITDDELVPGNSGSGIYDKETDKLVGILWGKGRTDPKTGEFTPLFVIAEALDDIKLSWTLGE